MCVEVKDPSPAGSSVRYTMHSFHSDICYSSYFLSKPSCCIYFTM